MAVDYAALKKGGFMRQKQKNNFSLRLQVVGGNLFNMKFHTLMVFFLHTFCYFQNVFAHHLPFYNK